MSNGSAITATVGRAVNGRHVMVRNIAAGVLMLVAVVFWFGPALGGTSGIDGSQEAIDDALANDLLNNTRTEGAPQQQVVNGIFSRSRPG